MSRYLFYSDIFVVCARCKRDKKVRGFILEGTKGLTAPPIKNELALRCSLTGSILDHVTFSRDAVLPHGPRSTVRMREHHALPDLRHQSAWVVPFQLTQKKLVDAQTEVIQGLFVGRLKDEGKVTPEMISLAKRNYCRKALEATRKVLDILGGMRAPKSTMLEGISRTYRASIPARDIHMLILGKAIGHRHTDIRKP
ncbi:hypothetical protein C8Q74DRAFT_1364124 [Fomes fomentarius]|nr:hypothetical protein C8Q74DRAFT_1364124 [Fomes fomentarius]